MTLPATSDADPASTSASEVEGRGCLTGVEWDDLRAENLDDIGNDVRGWIDALIAAREAAAATRARTEVLLEAAAWVAESIGYPVEVKMPDHPAPQALWDALVDHIHADVKGKWHGMELDRESTEWWLADEAGRADSLDPAPRGDGAEPS